MTENQKAPFKPPKIGLTAYRLAAAASSRQTRRQSPKSDHTSAHLPVVRSFKAISPHLSNNPYSASTAFHSSLIPVQTVLPASSHKTSAVVRAANPNHIYWCTVCGNRSYQNSDDWKKHEKEHEIKYVCMLNGLLEPTDDAQKCVLCGVLNPADSHQLAHIIAPCLEAPDRPSFKRRYEMVGHLKAAHNISNGGTIADKWLCKSSKKAWSCGFCIRLFPTLKDRLRHVGTEHFEKGQSINDWDITKVIQGLLLQPGIQEAWQHLLNTLDPFRLSEIKWNKLGSKDLQRRLEKGLAGEETPQSLAKGAYDNAEYDWSLADMDDTIFATATNYVPDQHTNKSSSLLSQEHAVASREAPVECEPWSSPQHQASQTLRSGPTSDAQSAYVTAASNSPPAHHVPALDYGPMWKPLASDTDDMNSTRPTTPLNDRFGPANPLIYTPWGGYNTTPDPAHSDQEIIHSKSDSNFHWSSHPHPGIDVENRGPTLKRPRDSVSPPAQALPRSSSLNDRPRKK